MTTTEILSRLENVKKTGAGWMARCPAHDDKEPSLSISAGDHGRTLIDCKAGCPPDSVCARIGLTLADLFADTSKRNGAAKRIVATYDYTDADRKLIFQVCRYEPKDFRQRRPDGNGGWTWDLKGVETILFRLPEITRDVKRGLPIVICEGEKDALALVEKGFSATCNPMGAGKWRARSNAGE